MAYITRVFSSLKRRPVCRIVKWKRRAAYPGLAPSLHAILHCGHHFNVGGDGQYDTPRAKDRPKTMKCRECHIHKVEKKEKGLHQVSAWREDEWSKPYVSRFGEQPS